MSCLKIRNIFTFAPHLLFIFLIPLSVKSQGQDNGFITIDSLTVNDQNQISVSWTLETTVENGYVEIHRNLDDQIFDIIQLLPLESGTFIDNSIDADTRSYSYYVVPYDENDNQIVPTNRIHTTIFLEEPQVDVCAKTINLNWDNYVVSSFNSYPDPFDTPFDSTVVMLSYSGNNYEMLLNNPFDENIATIPIENPGEYCVKIRSYDPGSDLSSTSNSRCFQVNLPPAPADIKTRKVSLTRDESAVEIDYEITGIAESNTFFLQRLDVQENIFETIDSVKPSGNQPVISFLDQNSRAREQSETYKCIVTDSCRNVVWETSPVSTIYLKAINDEPGRVSLEWNLYDGWESWQENVSQYNVYFRDGNSQEMTFLNIVEATTKFFTHFSDATAGETYYRVEALKEISSENTSEISALSNLALVSYEPEVFIPNAINPTSNIEINRRFQPVFTNFTPGNYQLSIFNRWGELVFQSDDITQGWNGRRNSDLLSSGVYFYVLSFTDNSGKNHEKKGEILLMVSD